MVRAWLSNTWWKLFIFVEILNDLPNVKYDLPMTISWLSRSFWKSFQYNALHQTMEIILQHHGVIYDMLALGNIGPLVGYVNVRIV